jgi:hypothetical protein
MKAQLKLFLCLVTCTIATSPICCFGETATLSVSPSVTSNTYTGVIMLTISGLGTNEQVGVERYLDLNSNGVVDASEPMVDAFKITDNHAKTIGGVTNINQPFDSNPTNGVITATLSFMPILQNIVGQQIFQVVSLSNTFSPVTATFVVTNAALAQSVSGYIYTNGVRFSNNAVVVAELVPNMNYAGAVISDNTGHYFLTLNPGTYALLPVFPGTYTDESISPIVTLTNGMKATNNLYLTNGTVTISGNVYNAANSNGMSGVLVNLQSGNLFTVAFTDTNGNYSAAVTPTNWTINVTDRGVVHDGYVVSQNRIQFNAASNITNANLPVFKGDAIFYGRITNAAGVPFANLNVEANDSSLLYESSGFSDTNGYYTVVGLSSLIDTNADNEWTCEPWIFNNVQLANYIINRGPNMVLAANQAVPQDFLVLPIIGTISGRLQDNSNNAVDGVIIQGDATVNGLTFESGQSTTNGDYSIGVASGYWNVWADQNGQDSLASEGYYDPNTSGYFVAVPPTNVTLNITVYPIGTPFLGQPVHFSPTQFGFSFFGAPGSNYTVQASSSLASGWTNVLVTNMPGTNSPSTPIFLEDDQATNSQRFYRALQN